MDVYFFDVDNTLALTDSIAHYRASSAGFELLPSDLDSGKATVYHHPNLTDYVNTLVADDQSIVVAISDSPTEYINTIFQKINININPALIFGNAKKPFVDIKGILDVIRESTGHSVNIQDAIVIGDNPKDIYMAHNMGCASILYLAQQQSCSYIAGQEWRCEPTVISRSSIVLVEQLKSFKRREIRYQAPTRNLSAEYHTVHNLGVTVPEFDTNNIGYSREYVTRNEWRADTHDKQFYFQILNDLKKAKNQGVWHHRNNRTSKFFIRNGDQISLTESHGLKSFTGFHSANFHTWVKGLGLSGKILLIPLPPSSPSYVNRSFPMLEIAGNLSFFSGLDDAPAENGYWFESFEYLERTTPVPPAHTTPGARTTEPHELTIGISKELACLNNVTNIILIDDIVTSGTQMNVCKTLIETCGIFPNIPVHMFAIGKTTHPTVTFDFGSL